MVSKSTRILILLAIDSAFFLLELVVGYAVHSLALVADSFHMLNDVLSLCVGLWAVRIANTGSSKMYTYGWQRAETLGALVNGVFLVALCLSIFLEAIQRFVEPQVVTNPKLVLIVGCFGLASNILGLFLFHDHGHSHGGHEHSHSHDSVSNAEQGHGHSHGIEEAGIDLLGDDPSDATDAPHAHVAGKDGADRHSHDFNRSDEDNITTVSGRTSGTLTRKSIAHNDMTPRKHRRSSRGFSVDNVRSPNQFRHDIIAASKVEEQAESEPEEAIADDDDVTNSPTEQSSLVQHGTPAKYNGTHSNSKKKSLDNRRPSSHTGHNHSKPKDGAKGGHDHGDLNMHGVFLHVMGDALGNIGVIASALFIWLTNFKWRYYSDPAISLIITIIILTSAIPLCKAASKILLQAVPTGMDVDEIKEDIERLDGVISAHHLHVWQLSGSKFVASLHVQVDCDVQGTGSASYMELARKIRKELHLHDIHSSTIQPEFCSPSTQNGSPQAGSGTTAASGSADGSPKVGSDGRNSKAGSVQGCMLECDEGCGNTDQCCPAPAKD